jgi:hypothetical protein
MIDRGAMFRQKRPNHPVMSFPDVAQAYYRCTDLLEADPKKQTENRPEFEKRIAQFIEGHGAPEQLYWCERARVAGVRTEMGYLCTTMMTEDVLGTPVDVLTNKCEALNKRAERELARADWLNWQDTLWVHITGVLSLADLHKQGADTASLVEELEAGITASERLLEERVQRRNRDRYLLGILIGTLTLLPAGAALTFVAMDQLGYPDYPPSVLVAAVIFGGLGGSVSVLSRVTYGRFRLDVSGNVSSFVRGMARPVVGAVFALALFSLTVGGVLPLKVPPSHSGRLFFFAGLGFIAGFSERFAEDQFRGAVAGFSGGVSATTDDQAPGTPPPPTSGAGVPDAAGRSTRGGGASRVRRRSGRPVR